MGEVTTYTSTRINELIAGTFLDADVVGEDLILTRGDASQVTLPLQSGTNVVNVAAPTGVAATDTAAIVAGVAAAALPLGGDVLLQAGNYATNASIAVPPQVRVRGAGMRATVVTYSGTGYAFSVGNAVLGTALAYGCAVVDLAINLTANGGNGITLRETAGAQVRNVYIEGVIITNTSVGVFVDGGNTSNIFTRLDNVLCNHIKFSHRWGTSGTTQCTSINAMQCTGLGDLVAGSVGLQIDGSCGDGSTWVGGNFESCATGLSFSGSNVSFFGVRFEANTVDVTRPSDISGRNLRLIGCHYIGSFVDSAGPGFNALTVLGCSKEDGTPYPDTVIGSSIFGAHAADDIPISARGFPTQTGKMLRLASALDATLFDVDAGGGITALSGRATKIIASTGYPNGAISAVTGSICLVEGGGAGQTLWVKESGTGNTGWVAK